VTSLATEQPLYTLVIDGQRVEAAAGHRYDTIDPFLGAPWASAADGDADDVNRAVAAARRALTGPWGQLTGFGRAALMRRLAELIVRDADRLAEIETRDTGKLLREMRGQLATIPSGSTTSPGWPISSRARRSRWTSRIFSSTPGTSRPAWSRRSSRGTSRCCC
jgi:hypothetical protein